MSISRFQLKLMLVFLIVLFVLFAIAVLLTNYILKIERTGMAGEDVDKKIEEVLQEASEIAYNMIEESALECQSIAEELAEDREMPDSLDSPESLEKLVNDILPAEDRFSVVIFDLRDDKPKSVFYYSSPTDDEDLPESLIAELTQREIPFSQQQGRIVYGVAPVAGDEHITGAVVIGQKLKQELVKNIIDLQNLLGVYAVRPDLNRLTWLGIISMVVVLVITGTVLSAIFARRITKPILSLVAGTKEIARGNLDYRVQVKGKDEVATLVESFNSMATQLKASRERLMRAERLAAWRDIARRIAHEIKNPLTPIQLSMYRLRKNLGSDRYDDIFQQAYTSITNEVENLRNMVTEFSDFARMPKPRAKPSDPKEIVQDAINLYTGLPENINLQTELADDLPQVMADKDQIRQVLHNLIGNAVDAMPDGGQLSVRLQSEDHDNVVIEIADTGCGMSEEVKQKLFTPYFTTKETGTGLGMAITAQIIEDHGGEIQVDSQEGVGTTVTVKLHSPTEDHTAT
jgi:nitrogen fixation/metabolism regulation signal transduction histidine kinase